MGLILTMIAAGKAQTCVHPHVGCVLLYYTLLWMVTTLILEVDTHKMTETDTDTDITGSAEQETCSSKWLLE